eukprot:NODE_12248_length_237_cov_26.675532_g10478_i0.p1 GENE.NODE_12248_length_237_cov_26.675532_g10478_i0~~NODE_12248_length_237_cov_26.675532_g10478_i0.p1  ORF type:complete len:59 (-),score=2.03 NODE_12248_length_237_cov_26.675532_g10478_i0:33-209(-)
MGEDLADYAQKVQSADRSAILAVEIKVRIYRSSEKDQYAGVCVGGGATQTTLPGKEGK